jgi:hypothetical protein
MSDKKDVFIHSSNFGSYIFKDVNVLDHPVDYAFEGLYNAAAIDLLSGMQVTPGSILGQEFVKQSIDYFKTKTASGGANAIVVGDQYIENLTILPNHFNSRGDFKSSYAIWLSLLKVLDQIEKAASITLHKGTAYYFAGGDAIEVNDFESGMIMMHLALQEDQRNNPQWQTTPAYAFMSINPDNVGQFHRPLVNAMAALIKNRLTDGPSNYHKTRVGTITYDDFRKKLLQDDKNLPSSTRYYFVYSLLRFWHMRRIDKSRITDDVISPMVFGNAIGSLLLVVETLLEKIVPAGSKSSMQSIVESLGLGISCGTLNTQKDTLGFEGALKQLIAQNDIKSDFEIAYLCRNQIFHVIKDEKIYDDHYMEITQAVFNCIFYAVEKHY